MLNRICLVGRLVRDPELRRTGNGTAVTSFTLAANRSFANQNGERQADFIPCVVWNKAAESTARYCSKGSLVGVDGRLQSRQYEEQDGRKRTVLEVICDSVQFLETKNASQGAQTSHTSGFDGNASKYSSPTQNGSYGAINGMADINSFPIMDDDIQF